MDTGVRCYIIHQHQNIIFNKESESSDSYVSPVSTSEFWLTIVLSKAGKYGGWDFLHGLPEPQLVLWVQQENFGGLGLNLPQVISVTETGTNLELQAGDFVQEPKPATWEGTSSY